MDFTRQELEDAALLLVVDERGHYKWVSTRSDPEVVAELRAIATRIADDYARNWASPAGSSDICAIHLSPRAIEEDPSICWEYDGETGCQFTSRHEART